MISKYAYSLNGEHYQGCLDTREQAIDAGFAAARSSPDAPQTVYVGRRVPADPKADGHARSVISHMIARAREEFGDAAAGYLANLSKAQIESLDQALEAAVRGWLQGNDLVPTFHKIEAIGEYSVPPVQQTRLDNPDNREVQEIGSEDYIRRNVS